MIFSDKYQEREGVPTVRIAGKLSAVEKAIYLELELGGEIRNVSGAVRKKNDMEALGMHLTNRWVYNYFKECRIEKPHKLDEVIRNHFLAILLWEI